MLGDRPAGWLGDLPRNVQRRTGSRVFLFVGVLGGFTTFSAFGYDTLILARDGYMLLALGNVALQIVLGLGAVWVGYKLAVLT